MATYDERLRAPLSWWALPLLFLAPLYLSYLRFFGWAAATAVTVALAALVVVGLVWYGSARVRVADGQLLAGRAVIGVEHLGPVRVLSPEQAREVRGPKADPRAYLLLRAYVPGAVVVEVVDPADPTPYWYLSTRRPRELAAAIEAARAAAPTG